MASLMTPSLLTLSDLERSKSRSLRFSVVGYLYGIDIFASSNITTIWMSQKGVCWRAGFSAVPAVFLVLIKFITQLLNVLPAIQICMSGLLGRRRTKFIGRRYNGNVDKDIYHDWYHNHKSPHLETRSAEFWQFMCRLLSQ